MSTLAQIGSLNRQLAQLSSQLNEIRHSLHMRWCSYFAASLQSLYLRSVKALRKPATEYSLWFVGLLIVGTASASAFTFSFLFLIGVTSGSIISGTISAGITMLSLLATAITCPASSSLPARIAKRDTQKLDLFLEISQLSEVARTLKQQISSAKSNLRKLHNSERYKRELLLEQNWKAMRGIEWEEYLVQIFNALGATAETTRTTGDQGVDLLVRFGEMRIAVQAKGYAGSVGNSAVQQVVAGKVHYGCTRAAVITNSRFTASARALAQSNLCFLIGEQEFPAFVMGSNLELFQ